MSASVIRKSHASWDRNLAAHAYRTAVSGLKKELGIAENTPIPFENLATIDEVNDIVQAAKQKYEDASKQHTGARRWLERLSCRTLYYGRALDMLAQHHPEYVALAWGAIKMILMSVQNRANLVQQLSRALVAIADVLPRAHLSAELYKNEYMEAALSRLYTHIILFFQLCVRWYNRSPVGRLWSAFKAPFELDYQDLVEQIKICSATIEDIANAGVRAEIRHIRSIVDLHHALSMEKYTKILENQAQFETSITHLTQVATSSKAITEVIDGNVRVLGQQVYRIEFHNVLKFFTPKAMPDVVLRKVRSFAQRNRTPSMCTPADTKIEQTVRHWVSYDRSSMLVVKVSPRAQTQAKSLATEMIEHIKRSGECVFWSVSLFSGSGFEPSISGVLKNIIFQILHRSSHLYAEYAEQLNLEKIQSAHTDREWADLLCLLFDKLGRTFVVIETEELEREYRDEPNWSDSLLALFQRIVDHATDSGNQVKIMLLMYGGACTVQSDESMTGNRMVASLAPAVLLPPRLRHLARRSGFDTKGWKSRQPKF